MADRGYVYLLNHLHRPTTTVPLPTVQASIAHYLAHLQPSPTSLAGTLVGSPLFRPFTHAGLNALCTALRHALHIRLKLFKGENRGVFVRGVRVRTAEWVGAVLEGLRGGHPVARLVCAGGLLLGLDDLEDELRARDGRMRRETEEEVILALAEVIDTYACKQSPAGWENDFEGISPTGEEPLPLALLFSSQFIPLLLPRRLQTLPLPILADLIASTIESAFQNGTFLSSLPQSLSRDSEGRFGFAPTSPFAQNLQALTSSQAFVSLASLARSCAQVLSVLTEYRPIRGWPVMAHGLWRLESLAQKIEAEWMKSPLAVISDENAIAPEAREATAMLWNIFKNFLFTSIMISQAALSSVVFNPHPPAPPPRDATTHAAEMLTPYALAVTALRVLAHLAFVLHQFGGVAAPAEGGFAELRRAFYTALDVLAASAHESEQFVVELCDSFRSEELLAAPAPFVHMKKAYALACVEQLVPVLGDARLRTDVFELCAPHLGDPAHRATYEAAHSVMLALFAAYAKQVADGTLPPRAAFAEVLVPFYAACLIENSADGRLSTAQLGLAYAALVRSAGALRQQGAASAEGDVMAWFCVEKLLDALRVAAGSEQQRHRLRLTLVATLPGLSLALLPRVLEEVKGAIIASADENSSPRRAAEQKRELVRAVFRELAENVGDGEKEFAMRWWYENLDVFADGFDTSDAASEMDRVSVSNL